MEAGQPPRPLTTPAPNNQLPNVPQPNNAANNNQYAEIGIIGSKIHAVAAYLNQENAININAYAKVDNSKNTPKKISGILAAPSMKQPAALVTPPPMKQPAALRAPPA